MLIKLDYLKQKYNITAKGCLHIGASHGEEAEMYKKCGIEKVIWIEALPHIYKKLLVNIAKYPNHLAFNACIGDKDFEVKEFNISSNDGQSSSYLKPKQHIQEHPSVTFLPNTQKMQTFRIDTLFSQNNIDSAEYDFLNIDIQGAELLALKGMGKLLNNFKYAYLEVNTAELYEGCALVGEIDEYLAQFGFKGVEQKITDHYWGDKFYVKAQ